jgi:hypothetical protein
VVRQESPVTAFLREGWRIFSLRAPSSLHYVAGPRMAALLTVLLIALSWGGQYVLYPGKLQFNPYVLSAGWLATLMMAFCCWLLADSRPRVTPAAVQFSLLVGASYWLLITALVLYQVTHAFTPARANTYIQWAIYSMLAAWSAAVILVFWHRIGLLHGWRGTAAAVCILAVTWVSHRYPSQQPWIPVADGATAAAKPYLSLTEENLSAQSTLIEKSLQAITPQRAGVTDLYFVQFAPYARDEVFLRETTSIGALMNTRFDAAGRAIHLVNHATTVLTHPWASATNLERAIQTVGERMDVQEDALVLYLTSHGSKSAVLSASHYPLQLTEVSAPMLRSWLDAAGIVNRVIIVSACHSGSFIEPLKTPTTLILTAASAEKTSFGCGDSEDYTYFAKALFDEQLRTSHDFVAAFNAAVPRLRAREEKEGFTHSEPQIFVGASIQPVLQRLYARLQQAPTP